jgi:hypothetical protein
LRYDGQPQRYISSHPPTQAKVRFQKINMPDNTSGPPEQLFLNISPASILSGNCGARTSEPWATSYRDAISERRFGDAIYFRYCIDGRSTDGILHGTNHTVQEEILIDAKDYYLGYPNIYAEALAFYLDNSDQDTRSEIIEAIRRVPAANRLGRLRNMMYAPIRMIRDWSLE